MLRKPNKAYSFYLKKLKKNFKLNIFYHLRYEWNTCIYVRLLLFSKDMHVISLYKWDIRTGLTWCTLYFSRKDMMLAAMGTRGYLTSQRWASTSTARHRPSHTQPAQTSSPRTSPHLTSPCRTPSPATRTLTSTRSTSTRYTRLRRLTSNSHGRGGRVKSPSGATGVSDSGAPSWAWTGARPGWGGMASGDQICCLHTYTESTP